MTSVIQRSVPEGLLTLYQAVPTGEIDLEQFETLAVDRLQVLRKIDDLKSRGRRDDEMEEQIQLAHRAKLNEDKKDIISHTILRLAYCRTDELRRWFTQQESDLFKFRLKTLSSTELLKFVAHHNLPYKPIPNDEFQSLKADFIEVLQSQWAKKQAIVQFTSGEEVFKVPFEQVPDLVAQRKVLVKGGFAYVFLNQLPSLLIGFFRCRLQLALRKTCEKWFNYLREKEMDRLTPIVEGLSERYVGPDASQFAQNEGSVHMQEIPKLAKENFPLCMQNLYYKLKDESHLKHAGRIQLGLFIKGIGLPLEEALIFWKQEFANKVASDKFDKDYAYNIRHNYGKEGKRVSYNPQSCKKIINQTPGVGEHHGCPFKLCGEIQLRSHLQRMGISNKKTQEISQKAKQGQHQIACALTFESRYGINLDTLGTEHPNAYFNQSRSVDEAFNLTPETLLTPQSNTLQNISAMNITPAATREEQLDKTPVTNKGAFMMLD